MLLIHPHPHFSFSSSISFSLLLTSLPSILPFCQKISKYSVKIDLQTYYRIFDFLQLTYIYIYMHLYFIYNFAHLFIFVIFDCAASLSLHRLFSSCGEWGLPYSFAVWASHCGGFSCGRAQTLGGLQQLWHLGSVVRLPGSRAQAQLLWGRGLASLQHVVPS